jgi:hypothetical protein
MDYSIVYIIILLLVFIAGVCLKDTFKDIFIGDWKIVWQDVATWTITYDSGHKSTVSCEYFIYYSKDQKKYKLKTEGYCPKEHDDYNKALKKFNELIQSSKE